MATDRIGKDIGLDVQEHIGLTADTSAFLAANITFANGSTYKELDGLKRKYQILNSTWYEIESSGDIVSGENGSKAITGTNAVTPDTGYYFTAIQVIEDAVVVAQGDLTGATNADLTVFTTLVAGTVIYGKWDSITLTSGEAIGYYGRE